MEPEAPKPRKPRRWVKSLIVLLIGLAYLGGVYVLVPELRISSRHRYEPPDRSSEGGVDEHRAAFDRVRERLARGGARFERLRVSAKLTWLDAEGEEWRVADATLVLERPDKMRFLIESGDWLDVCIRNGARVWVFSSDATGVSLRAHAADANAWWCLLDALRIRGSVVFAPAFESMFPLLGLRGVVVFYPYVCPQALGDVWREPILGGTPRVSASREEMLDGRHCEVVRVESATYTCDLWVVKGEDLLLKTEYYWHLGRATDSRRPVRKLAGIRCVLTDLEDDPVLDEALFDALPTAREFSERALKRVVEDLEEPAAEEAGSGAEREPDDSLEEVWTEDRE